MKVKLCISIFIVFLIFSCKISNPKSYEIYEEEGIIYDIGTRRNANSYISTLIQPIIDAPITKGKNIIYCLSFQLAWDELNKKNGALIKIDGGGDLVNKLNDNRGVKKYISDEFIVVRAGLVKGKTIESIKKELSKKFNASPILDIDLKKKQLFAFGYLQKILDFEADFERDQFGKLYFDSLENVEYFYHYRWEGNSNDSSIILHDYKNQDDFIVELKLKGSNDQIILAKIGSFNNLLEAYNTVIERVEKGNSILLRKNDFLAIPYVKFHIIKEYPELYGEILNQNFKNHKIELAEQVIDFDLNEKGITLISYAYMMESVVEQSPKSLLFDKPFLLIMKERGKALPYYLMWIANTEIMRK